MTALAIIAALTLLGLVGCWVGNRVVKATGESDTEPVQPLTESDLREQRAEAQSSEPPITEAQALKALGWTRDDLKARWVNDEELSAGAQPGPESHDPWALRSWLDVGNGKRRLTLNNGLAFEGYGRGSWLVYPSGEDAASYACDIAAKLNQQIDWGQHADKREAKEIERFEQARPVVDRQLISRIGQVATAVDNVKLYGGHIERERRLAYERNERQRKIDAQMGTSERYPWPDPPRYTSGILPVKTSDGPSSVETYVRWNSEEELDQILSDPETVSGIERARRET